MSVFEFLGNSRIEGLLAAANKQKRDASYAGLNWEFETIGLINSVVDVFPFEGYGRYVRIPTSKDTKVVQFSLHTDAFYPSEIGGSTLEREKPASITYSLMANGGVIVSAYPHSTVYSSGAEKQYILDIIPHVWDLSGDAGRYRVRRHLRCFGKLAVVSRAETFPTKANGKFLLSLADRREKYAPIFADAAAARNHQMSQDANFSIGLVVGVIPSIILPFARDIGIELGRDAEKTKALCDKFESASRQAKCLSENIYFLDKNLSLFLSTGYLLAFALLLACGGLLTVLRIKNKR